MVKRKNDGKMKPKKNMIILGSLYVLISICFYFVFVALPPVQELGEAYRIFFLHLPFAIVTYIAFTVTLVTSILYLKGRDSTYDSIASSSAKLGLIFCSLTLIAGAIFSNAAWGAYWNWDPRQTTTLILWFVYASYLSLRSAIDEDETKAMVSSVLGIFGYATVPLTYISTKVWSTLHPESGTIGLTGQMWLVILGLIVAMMVLYTYLLWWDVKFKSLEKKYKKLQDMAKGGEK